MKKTLIIGLTALAMNAHAATTIHSAIVGGPHAATTFSFPQHNTALGPLTSVTFEISASAAATLGLTNIGESEASYSAALEGTSTGVVPTISLGVTFADAAGPVILSPSASTSFGVLSDSGTDSGTAGDFSAYEGLGTVEGTILQDPEWSVTGNGDSSVSQTGTTSSLEWTVTYEYEEIPEPSTALLGLVGLLGLARRRR